MGSFRGDPSIFTPRETHFFKIILQDVIDSKKLIFPKKFVMENGSSLAREAILKVPSGVVWKMDLLKSNGDVWLDKGWQEFSDYHTLRFGDFVVFKYYGNSEFSVVILDRSMTEIEYPITDNNTVKHNHDEGFQIPVKKEIDVHIADGNLDDFSPNPRKRKAEGSCHPLPGLDSPAKRVGKGSDKKKSATGRRRGELVTIGEKRDVLQRACSAFKSEKPLLRVLLQPSYIRRLAAPRNFFDKHFPQGSHVMLQVGNKCWRVNMSACDSNLRQTYFSSGWRKFVGDNSLKVGDVCVFELIDRKKAILKVFISRYAV